MEKEQNFTAKIFPYFLILFLSIVAYHGSISDRWYTIEKIIRELEVEQVEIITLRPFKETSYSRNLITRPVAVRKQEDIQSILDQLRGCQSEGHEKLLQTFWEVELEILLKPLDQFKLKSGNMITLYLERLEPGLYFEMINVMGYHTYRCPDELINVIEGLAKKHGACKIIF